MKNPPQQLHIPVLLDDVLNTLNPLVGESYLDLTAGYGGHARKIIEQTKTVSSATLCDRDSFAISHLSDLAEQGAQLIHQDFLASAKHLQATGSHFDMILLDLGVSSPQLDIASRGFSFNHDGPLDMRMDNQQELTAATIINQWDKRAIQKIFVDGDIPHRLATILAQAIVIERKKQPIETTGRLAEIIRRKVGELDGGKYHKTHPATKPFLAIRIAVNDEMNQLKQVLPILIDLLAPKGRLAIITFHSLEDRIVKQFMRDQTDGWDAPCCMLLKKPISGENEDVFNPRARSAMLRAVLKK